MSKLISVFLLLTLLLISVQITFARDERERSEKRIPAKECKEKDKNGKYKNEGKICIAIKKNPEFTGRCKEGYCREWRY